MIPLVKDSKNCILSGSVIIEGVEHLVQSRFVKCNASLNNKVWNTTERKGKCLKCFPEPTQKRSCFSAQLELF